MRTIPGLLGTLTAAGAGNWLNANFGPINAQATLTGNATAAVVAIEVSNDQLGAIPVAMITLDSGTPSDGFVFDSFTAWQYVRARLVSISGIGAALCTTVTKGYE